MNQAQGAEIRGQVEKTARIKGNKRKQSPDLAVFLARQYRCQFLKTSEIKTLLGMLRCQARGSPQRAMS